ncbi:MAG: SH3 domain-containing protein [bacterium]|nr:SH3 domain-containing protein [bacterium]
MISAMNSDKRIVIRSYQTQYKNPLTLVAGDIVKLGKEESKDEWKGWIWAETSDNSGWIPLQIIKPSGNDTATITESYTAKELDVTEGIVVSVIKELNGWLWLRNDAGDEGWIPKEYTAAV